jgi:tape measure domain-containing protein
MAGDLSLFVDLNTQAAANQVERLFNEFRLGSKEAGEQLNRVLGGSVEKKVRIRLEKDTSGIKQVKAELVELQSAADGILRAYQKANKTQPGSLTSLRQQVNEARQFRDALALFGREIDIINKKQLFNSNINPAFAAANQNLQRLEQQLRNLELATGSTFGKLKASLGVDEFLKFGRGIQDLVTIFQSLGIAISAITAPINQAANSLARLQGLELAFKSIGAGSAGANTALQESSRIALGLGVSLDTVRNGFQKLSPVILNSGGNLDDVSNILEALSSRFAAFGLNADESRRVLNGVIQAFAKGKLQAEELTQQISEADPAFKTDLAKAIFVAQDSLKKFGIETNGTVQDLEKLVKSGKLTSEVLIKVLPGLSKSSLLFGKLGVSAKSAIEALRRGDVTITQVRTQLENLNQLSFERLAKIFEPVIGSFIAIQGVVTDFFDRVSKVEIIQSLANVLAKVSQALLNLTEFIANGIEGFIRLFDIIGKVAGVIAKLLGPIADFVSGLANLPGLLEVIGFILIAKLIKPAKEALSSVVSLTRAINNFGQTGQIRVSLDDDLSNGLRQLVSDASKVPQQIAESTSKGTGSLFKASSAEGIARLNELRNKFNEVRKDINEPLEIAPIKTPKQLGISKKIIEEVRESQDSLQGLYQQRAELQKRLSDLEDPNKNAKIVAADTERELGVVIAELAEADQLIEDIKDAEVIDGKALRRAEADAEKLYNKFEQLSTLRTQLKGGLIPDTDERKIKRTITDIASIDRQIQNFKKVRSIQFQAVINDQDFRGSVDDLRAQIEEKLDLEATIKAGVDVDEGDLRRLEEAKRQIRFAEPAPIKPVVDEKAESARRKAALDAINEKKRLNDFVLRNIGLEDQVGRQLQQNVKDAQKLADERKKALDTAKIQSTNPLRAGLDIDAKPAAELRTEYEESVNALRQAEGALQSYNNKLQTSFTATNNAATILDNFNNKAIDTRTALTVLSAEQARFSGLQAKTASAINRVQSALTKAENKYKDVQSKVAQTSFGSSQAEAGRQRLAALGNVIDSLRSRLNALEGVSQNASANLNQIGTAIDSVKSAPTLYNKFRVAVEAVSNAISNAKTSISGFGQGISDGIKGIQSGFSNVTANANAFGKVLGSAFSDAKKGATSFGSAIKSVFSGDIGGAVTSFAQGVSRTSDSIKTLGDASKNIGTNIGNTFTKAGQSIKAGFQSALQSASGAAKAFGSNLKDSIGNSINASLNAVKRLGSSLKGIFLSLGPELAIFAALALATAAYNKAAEKRNAINEAAKTTTETLAASTKDLNDSLANLGGASLGTQLTDVNKQFSGLEKILLVIGNILLDIQGAFERLINFFNSSTPAIEGVTSAFDRFAKTALIIGGFTALGAAIGSVIPVVGTLAGAIAGAAVGAFVAGTIATRDYTFALKELEKELDAVVEASKNKALALQKVAVDIKKAKEEAAKIAASETGSQVGSADALFTGKGIAAATAAKKAYREIQAEIKGIEAAQVTLNKEVLNNQIAVTQAQSAYNQYSKLLDKSRSQGGITDAENKRLKELGAALEAAKSKLAGNKAALAQYEAAWRLAAAQERIAKDAILQIVKALGISEPELDKIAKGSINGLKETLKQLQAAIEALDFSKAGQIRKLGQDAGEVNAQIEGLENIAKRGELEGYFRKTIQLLNEGKIPSSLTTINSLIEKLQGQIQQLDFTKPEDLAKIDQLAQGMGRLSAIVEVVEQRVEQNKLAGYIEQIKLGLSSGEIPRSLETIGNLAKALEERAVKLDINSPELPKVIEDLVKTKQEVDTLNGKRADITLKVIEEGLANGSIINTLGIIDQKIEALNQKKLSLPVDSAGYAQVIQQIDDIERRRSLSEQTTDQLLERKFTIQKERIDAVFALEKARSDQKIALIDREIDKVKDYYDEQIKALEKLRGPAEQQLEALKLSELQDKAKKGGREGLEARAELERLNREKQIAALREQQEQKIKELEKQKKAEQNAILDKELSVAEKRLALEEQITALRLKALGKEEADIDDILAQRSRASGTKAGTAYGQAFSEASTMVIREAKPDENDPATKVQFNYDNSQVLAAKDQVIQKENEYQGVLTETNALRAQLDAAQPGTDQSMILDQLIAKEQQLTNISAEQYQAEEKYNQVLRDTATITGDIVITNETLNANLGETAAKTEEVASNTSEVGAKADETKASFFDVNAAVGDLAVNMGNAKKEGEGLNDSTKQVSNSTKEIGEGVDKAKGGFEGLKGIVLDTDGAAKNTGDSFAGAAEKVNNSLLPSMESISKILETVQSKMNQIFDREYTVNVNLNVQKQGLWTGGPVTKGTTYQVNELGQEGFMNRFGKITPIKKARWGTWRAPSDGLVIPADIYSQLNTEGFRPPQAGVSHNTPSIPRGGKNNSTRELAAALAALGQGISNSKNLDLSELNRIQAHQSRQIGKLSRAIQDLNEKDWNVRVGIKNSGSLNGLKMSTSRL